MYDDDEFRAKLRTAWAALVHLAALLCGLVAAGAALWLLIRWLAS